MRIGTRLFGSSPQIIVEGDAFDPVNESTWAVHAGLGVPSAIQGTNYIYRCTRTAPGGYSTILAPGTEPHGGFYCLFGSCFLDYAYANDFMRALIGAHVNYNLGVMWFLPTANCGPTPLRFEQVGLGETVGGGFVRTVNESSATSANTYLGWIGDPTLRVQVVAPPTGAQASRSSQSTIQVSWTASPETGASLCHVYRSTGGLDGSWVLKNTAAQGSPFVDTDAPQQARVDYQYQVRAVKLTVTGSGSFYNLSQGAFSNTVH